jgi:signal peptidase II
VSESEQAAPPSLRGKGLALGLAAAITAADLWSKHAVFAALDMYEKHWIGTGLWGEWFGFTRVLNPGVMWGQLPQFSTWLPYVRVGAALIVLIMLRSTPPGARLMQVALGLVLGGALGNIYDGFFAGGKVRDFVMVDLGFPPFDPFPIFNVADSAICVGVGLLALSMLLERPRAVAAGAADGSDAPGTSGTSGAGTPRSPS